MIWRKPNLRQIKVARLKLMSACPVVARMTEMLRAALLGCVFLVVPALAQPPQAAKCEICHATGGSSGAPRLNGLSAYYILRRLGDFHDPASQSPHATYYMADQASGVSASQAHALAGHFSSLPPTPAQPGPLAVKGKLLYEFGDGYIRSCASCHGVQGEGNGSAPRLAGQRRSYLVQQLANLGMMSRFHPEMSVNVRHLSPDQAKALADYLGAD